MFISEAVIYGFNRACHTQVEQNDILFNTLLRVKHIHVIRVITSIYVLPALTSQLVKFSTRDHGLKQKSAIFGSRDLKIK